MQLRNPGLLLRTNEEVHHYCIPFVVCFQRAGGGGTAWVRVLMPHAKLRDDDTNNATDHDIHLSAAR